MSFDLSKIDLDRLKADVGAALADGLSDLLTGAKEDVKAFGADIAKDLLEAQLAGDGGQQGQLLDQLKVLAEINRVRVESHTWIFIEVLTKTVFRAVAAAAVAVIV